MQGRVAGLTLRGAREVLGVSMFATEAELRRGFREAAKRAHPDRPGGDEETFRRVMEAYELLRQRPRPDRFFQPPAPAAPVQPRILAVTPLIALEGGVVDHEPGDGRRLRISLPPGLRHGDRVRAGVIELEVAVCGDAGVMVRGDDLWVTVDVDPRLIEQGGRVAVDTPLGRRVVWITKEAGERGLLRLEGQGLPARGPHREGHLFLRLKPISGELDSAARALRRRFAAAWAA